MKNSKLQQLTALAGLAQSLTGGPQLAQQEHASRVASALQLLGLQQQQAGQQQQDAFRQQELAQRGSQFDQTAALTEKRLSQDATHQGNLETQAQENAKRQLQLGVLESVQRAKATGQNVDELLKYAGTIDPAFGAQQENAYWDRAGKSYEQNVGGFNALKTHDPMIDSAYFTQNQVPPEARQWLLEQLNAQHGTPTSQAPNTHGLLGVLPKVPGAVAGAVGTAGNAVGDAMSKSVHGVGHLMGGQDFDNSIQRHAAMVDDLLGALQGGGKSPYPVRKQMSPEALAADQAQTQRLLNQQNYGR